MFKTSITPEAVLPGTIHELRGKPEVQEKRRNARYLIEGFNEGLKNSSELFII